MSSYGDDLRCKDLHSTGVVKAQTLTVKKGGNFNAGGAYRITKPGNHDGAIPTPGAVGAIVFVLTIAGGTATDDGVWACKVGGASFEWAQIANKS